VAHELPTASVLEGLRFTLLGVLPNVVQGLFRRRPAVVALATRLNIDRRLVGAMDELRSRYGPGPVWVRVLTSRVLLILSLDDLRRVLDGSPDPFAADPDAKRRGMSHFQPDALTISRGEDWRSRRRFTEAVLDTGEPLHRLADRFLSVTREETRDLIASVEGVGRRLDFDAFHRTGRRIARRVILGDAAAGDEEVSDMLARLMSEANRLPKKPSERFGPFMARLDEYVLSAEDGSLVGMFGQAPSDSTTHPTGQVPHWMFALGDTLPANAFRALALIASHPRQRGEVEKELAGADLSGAEQVAGLVYLEACLEEALRLWPTTPLLSRQTLRETDWGEAEVPAGTQLLISNTFNHRDAGRHDFADRFAPEAWTDGDAGREWSFNQFSHGPQGCPGAGLALFVGKAVLASLLSEWQVRLLEPSLDPGRPLPHMLDYFRLRFALEPGGVEPDLTG
jgi:cytochrome P450